MRLVALCCFLSLLTGCSTYNIPDSPQFSQDHQWIVMPFNNYSTTPLAAEQAEAMVASVIQSEGVSVTMYEVSTENTLESILDSSIKTKAAKQWLFTQPASYTVSGSITEWRYKNGLDAEPVVGVTMTITDSLTNQVIWRATGALSGWGRESLAQTGLEVFEKLISDLDIEP